MRRAATALLGALALAATAAAPAGAAHGDATGLFNARYCEILELRGGFPDAIVRVWNTITLNRCPADYWDRIDAGALARDIGAGLVIKNGPRHFLMDSAHAETGGVRTFGGLRMRRVATLAIPTAADLVRSPYTDRTIERTNTWEWKRGRTVFELVAPGGDVYVMQSYAQIVDPRLTLGVLPGLGSRLALPPLGWRYRARRLARPLTLTANGRATILQDELQNTYQLARTTRTPAPRRRRSVHIEGATRLIAPTTPGTIEDRGTLTGTPFGRGTSAVIGRVANGGFTGRFWLRFRGGSVYGTVDLSFGASPGALELVGPGTVTGGTGRFRGVRGAGIRLRDRFDLNTAQGSLSVDGFVTY